MKKDCNDKMAFQMDKLAQRFWFCAASVLWSALFVGCADDGLVPVHGSVRVDGQPVELGTISFTPADGKGPSAEAVINAGAYTVSVAPGRKKVAIHGHKKVGEQFPWGKDNPPAPIYEEAVPARYNKNSELQCEINDTNSQHDFELES